MPKTLPSVALTLASLAPLAAFAATPEANFTGPLVTPAVNSMPEGMLNIEPYLIHTNTRGRYDNVGHRREEHSMVRQWQLALPMSYALSDTSVVQLTLTSSRTSGGGLHSDGMRTGDTSVRLQQRLRGPDADGGGLILPLVCNPLLGALGGQDGSGTGKGKTGSGGGNIIDQLLHNLGLGRPAPMTPRERRDEQRWREFDKNYDVDMLTLMSAPLNVAATEVGR